MMMMTTMMLRVPQSTNLPQAHPYVAQNPETTSNYSSNVSSYSKLSQSVYYFILQILLIVIIYDYE